MHTIVPGKEAQINISQEKWVLSTNEDSKY